MSSDCTFLSPKTLTQQHTKQEIKIINTKIFKQEEEDDDFTVFTVKKTLMCDVSINVDRNVLSFAEQKPQQAKLWVKKKFFLRKKLTFY